MFNWDIKQKPLTSISSLGGGAFATSISSSGPRSTMTDFVMEYYTTSGNPYYFEPWSMDVDSSGNIYIGGRTRNTSTQTYYTEWHVTKINSSGVIQWRNTTRLDPVSSQDIQFTSLQVSPDGVFVTVYFEDYGLDSWVRYYVTKYSLSDGSLQFTRNLTGPYNTQGSRVIASTKTTGVTNQIYVWHINRQIADGWYKWESWKLSASDGSTQSPFYINPGQYHMFNLRATRGYNGGVLVCGGPWYSNSQNTPEAAIYNFNTTGTLQWGKATSMNEGNYNTESYFIDCCQSEYNSQVFAIGYQHEYQGAPNYNYLRIHNFIFTWNSGGTKLYSKEFIVNGTPVTSGGQVLTLSNCVQSSDGHVYVYGVVGSDRYIIKLNSNLSIVWQKQIIMKTDYGSVTGSFSIAPSPSDNDLYVYYRQYNPGVLVTLKVAADGQGSGIAYLTNYGPNYTLEYASSNTHSITVTDYAITPGGSGGTTSSSITNSSQNITNVTQTNYSTNVIVE